MQIILHCGVYSSDTGILLKALQENCSEKLPYKTQVTDPEKTRVVLRKLLRAGRDNELPEDSRDIVLEMAGVHDDTERLILANPAVLGTYRDFVAPNIFFPNAVEYISTVRQIFAADDLAVTYAMRNPASLLSSVMKAAKAESLSKIIGEADPAELRWSELATRLSAAFPDISFTLWYNEDTPLIWRRLLKTLLDIPDDAPVKDAHSPLLSLLNGEDFKKFNAYISKHPGMIEAQERRVIATFIEKFAIENVMDEAIEIPDWTQDYVDQLSDLYEEDQTALMSNTDIRLIIP